MRTAGRLFCDRRPVAVRKRVTGPFTDESESPRGRVQHFRPGSSVPTDPTNFSGNFRFANAAAIFSGSQNGFTFSSTDASSVGVFAEVGKERNGIFLDTDDD